ncbi:hypothetical protein DERP_006722 [Dermatophagoides pteronyssinus]|uniref:Uncharacterized protein n=1 Tax=Dermatophagoides pteronyssinus TaxID=6956 RepID=A0ABQ8IS70_DERPT|nr:hypothetical protein DERP_006722 [Dermatophagoides pteronyssinus]
MSTINKLNKDVTLLITHIPLLDRFDEIVSLSCPDLDSFIADAAAAAAADELAAAIAAATDDGI